ncbi:alpha-glucan family phosphorylase [Pontibacter sp. G13]|uniref:alpha-glucan family phosphorylase n=1 Tax=Pontibacter sp. G13 TaxID=3074898 RepID=UPI00288C5638|nr:alpha-glucan family phosphorylase [Pontibacter sp. G13]WNJ17502.1 alpha-glucan family phosphorylase [Pontibacter sp. G13]
MKTNNKWEHPYEPAPEYSKRVAYFCMEFGIDPALKIYSGGLGYLAGSHMRSGYELKQNMIGIGMLWKYGYYDQIRDPNSSMRPLFRERFYTFLEQTDMVFQVDIHGHPVHIQVWYLAPEVFNTVPIYLLTTDLDGVNDYVSSTITHRLYDNNTTTRIAQSIVLGVGGGMLVDALGGADIYHLNEAHALPVAYHLYKKHNDLKVVKDKIAFTTHTPEKAGNEEHDINLLEKMGFFSGLPLDVVRQTSEVHGNTLGYTPTALKFARKSNGVSQLHAEVSKEMWKDVKGAPEIIGITNAQNQNFWQDSILKEALDADDNDAFKTRKRELKEKLFDFVVDQTGNLLDPDVLTIVWARRFAAYKRADLIMRDTQDFYSMLSRRDKPVQIIWAGKPYPMNEGAIDLFNHIIRMTHLSSRATVVTGYEMNLSALLKMGSDVWLNTPRRPREASGTSGMTAAMNGSVNLSIDDGWIPEFGKHGHNAFVLPIADPKLPVELQDDFDHANLMQILEDEIIPCYYDTPDKWMEITKNSMREVVPFFESGRMADEYYKRMFD